MSYEVGDVVSGRYKVQALAGHGGMSDVYKVWDEHRNCVLALKVLREDYATDPHVRTYFQREADALRMLNHPNIVHFYDFDQEGGFLIEDFVEGQTLRKLLASHKGPLPVQQTARIGLDVLAALSYAHREGWVHRDIKPGNIMIGADGRTYVTDFGIAKMQESASVTAIMASGTPAYMAPEQWEALRSADTRTDLYAFGVVLYEMATGRWPFDGEGKFPDDMSRSARIRQQHLHMEPPAPRALNPEVYPALASLILRCLEKEPARRYQTAEDAGQALAQATGLTWSRSSVRAPADADTTQMLGRVEATHNTVVSGASRASSDQGHAVQTKGAPVWRSALLGGGLVVLLLVTLGLTLKFSQLATPTPSPTPLPPPTSTAVSTSRATSAPAATWTPSVATAAPASRAPSPTSVPQPTWTPVPQPTQTPAPPPTAAVLATAEQAIKDYYSLLQNSDYATAWPMSREYTVARFGLSYDAWINDWNKSGPAIIQGAPSVTGNDANATVVVTLRYPKLGKTYKISYGLRRDFQSGAERFGYWVFVSGKFL